MTATLQMLLDEGIGLYVECGKCRHSAVVRPGKLIKKYGSAFPIPDVANSIRCTKCGHSPPEVQPDWSSKGPGVIVKAVP